MKTGKSGTIGVGYGCGFTVNVDGQLWIDYEPRVAQMRSIKALKHVGVVSTRIRGGNVAGGRHQSDC